MESIPVSNTLAQEPLASCSRDVYRPRMRPFFTCYSVLSGLQQFERRIFAGNCESKNAPTYCGRGRGVEK